MSDEAAEVIGGNDAPVVSNDLGAGAPAELTPNQAAKALADLRWKRNNESTAESADTATADPELSGEDNAAPQNEATGETQEADPAAKPPLELPRSWTKDRAEHWAKLDPGTQEFLLEQDRKASAEVRRVQNEAAEKLKGLTAKEQEVEKARQQYEAKLSSSVKFMEQALQSEFGDIQTMNDVRKLQAEDPFRFQAWQVRQMELTAAQAEASAVEQRQAQEKQSKRANYEAEQNRLLIELVPEMADPKKASELRERAIAMLTDDLGLKNDLLIRWMGDDTGHEILSNAGIQKLIADGLKYRDIQKAPKAVAKPDLPPVVRPGTSKPSGSDQSEQVKDLTRKLNETGDIRFAQQLRALQARSRAS
jgi:hypothetical protein